MYRAAAAKPATAKGRFASKCIFAGYLCYLRCLQGQALQPRNTRGSLQGLNIAEALDLTVSQARELFDAYPALARRLAILEEVGLGYIRLGQPAPTLSGGEAQRIKISRELGKRTLPGTLFIFLTSPQTGLHMHEVGKLIKVLHALVEKAPALL